MAAIPLKIVLHGLIALVPLMTPEGTDHMTALMLNSPEMAGMECPTNHDPKVSFAIETSAGSACLQADCERPQPNLCVCHKKALEGKDVTVEVNPSPELLKVRLPISPPRELPSDVVEAGSIGYLANLSRPPFNLRLDPRYLSANPPPLPLSPLLARFSFPFNSVTSCLLAKRFDKGVANIHSLTFGALGAEGQPGDASQAMAQQVVAEVTVRAQNGAPQRVSVVLKPYGQQDGRSIEVRAGDHGYIIEVTNDATPELPTDAPCDDGVARHFAHFNFVTLNPPAPGTELIPHVRPTQWQSTTGLTPPACIIPDFDPNDRPVCPMARIDPP